MELNQSVAIMGYTENGRKLKTILERAGFTFWGFIDNDIKKCIDSDINCKLPFEALKSYPDDFGYIMLPESYKVDTINNMVKSLKSVCRAVDEEHILIATWDVLNIQDAVSKKTVVDGLCSYLDWSVLPYLEFSVALHCNMNCRSCTHFSPLSKERFYDFDSFKRDITRLRELVRQINIIRIMGGEPLLNPRLADFVSLTREKYPNAEIQLVTNGLLVPSMTDGLTDALRQNKVIINISFYPALAEKVRDVIRYLEGQQLTYRISYMVTEFARILSKRNIGNPYTPFIPAGCTCPNLFEGKLSTCPEVMFISDLNERFDVDYPASGPINLHDETLDFHKLQELLKREVPLCEYCRTYAFRHLNITEPWQRLDRQAVLEDWLFDS